MNETEKTLYELVSRMTDQEFRELINLKRKELEEAETLRNSYLSESA